MNKPNFHRRKIGDQFEARAAAYLLREGYRILDRNRVYPWGEIDIIAEENWISPYRGSVRTLVFVEVRGTTDGAWISPSESILSKKAARLKRAIETYLLFYRGFAQEVRIDLMTIHGEQPPKHLPNFIIL